MKKTSADSDYFLRFHLDSDPFSADTWRYEPYLSSSVTRKLEQIGGLLDANCLVLVTAATGGGKSTIARQIVTLTQDAGITRLVTARPDTGVDALAQMLVQRIPPEATDANVNPVTALHRYLEYCDRNQVRQVFIVDDADRLSEEALEFLLQLSLLRYNETMFHFVLFGNEQMVDQLPESGQSDAGETAVRHVHLPAFTQEETSDYLRHRLATCGWTDDLPFSGPDLEYIQSASGGLPRAINNLARQKLLDISKPSPIRRHGHAVAIGAILAVAVVSAYYLLPRLGGTPATPARSPKVARHHPKISSAASSGAKQMKAKVPATSGTGSAAALAAQPKQPEPSQPVAPQTSPAPSTLPATANDLAGAAPASPMEKSQESAPASATTTQANTQNEPVSGTSAVQPGNSGGKPTAPAGSAATAREGGTNTTAAEQTTANKTTPGETETSGWHAEIRGPAWLRAQPAGTYFLQLINASDIQHVMTLLKDLDSSKDKLEGYTNFTPSGRPRYLLLYGEYPDRDSAVAAIAGLPRRIRSIPPWPRSVKGVMHDINNVESRGLTP